MENELSVRRERGDGVRRERERGWRQHEKGDLLVWINRVHLTKKNERVKKRDEGRKEKRYHSHKPPDPWPRRRSIE